MKRSAISFVLAFLVTFPTSATQTVLPPLTRATFVGVWEALFPDADHLLHMEIKENTDSYLCWATAGYECSCWRLLESDIKDGVVKLHFGKGFSSKGEAAIRELWLIGTGAAIDVQGQLDAQFCGNSWPETPPAPAKVFGVLQSELPQHIFFRKRTWARDLAAASQAAEQLIKDAGAKKP